MPCDANALARLVQPWVWSFTWCRDRQRWLDMGELSSSTSHSFIGLSYQAPLLGVFESQCASAELVMQCGHTVRAVCQGGRAWWVEGTNCRLTAGINSSKSDLLAGNYVRIRWVGSNGGKPPSRCAVCRGKLVWRSPLSCFLVALIRGLLCPHSPRA